MALDVPANSTGEEIRLVLYRAGRLQCKVVDRSGRPVDSGVVVTCGPLGHRRDKLARRFAFRAGEVRIPKAHLDCKYPLVLLDAAQELAATATLWGSPDSSLPEIGLQRCGSAYGRLLDADGQALAAAPLQLGAALTFCARDRPAEEIETNWYQALGRTGPVPTDDAGRFTLPALAPGVCYRLYVTLGGRRLAHEFRVTPGQALALPEKMIKTDQ
jgi:hypothetical protein